MGSILTQFNVCIEWQEASVNETCLNLIARLSSRVFLGEELCRDKHWLSIAKEYTVLSFNAARELRLWAPILRPIAVRFLDLCRQCQAMVAEACRIIRPVAAERNKARNVAAAQGIKYSETNDALDWLAAADKENRFDAGYIQLSLSFAAIHTTSDLLSETLLRIAKQPCIVSALREEICQVLKSDGWHKTALYKMKLLDSVLKETQRMKPITLGTFNHQTPPGTESCVAVF
jgi:cytochrome P450 monooxygenase-2